MRAAAASALLVLALLPLTGCGRPSYCEAVKSHQTELGRIVGSGDRDALLQALPAFTDLRSSAPADIADDWQLVTTRVRALQTALDDAGVDPASYDVKHPPAGLTAEQRTLIRNAAAALAASDTQQALASLQQQALDVCHTPLEL